MNSKLFNFNTYHVDSNIFLYLFDNTYDLCMHFLRYQEFHRSSKFRNQKFQILEFMNWYSKEFGDGIFTYTKDWSGFNIPSQAIWNTRCAGIDDYNSYDAAMIAAYNDISSNIHLVSGSPKYSNFYILGVCSKNLNALGHGMANALYATNKDFYEEIDKERKKLPSDVLDGMNKELLNLGYHEAVVASELQSYLATGLISNLKKYKSYTKPFQDIYNKYTKNIDLKFN